jgi:hypothetical protein
MGAFQALTQEIAMTTASRAMAAGLVPEREIDRKRRAENREEEEERHQADRSLDRGLEGTFPASDPVNVTQPAPTPYDRKPIR